MWYGTAVLILRRSPIGKWTWKKRTYTPAQKARRREWQREYRARPEVRSKLLPAKRASMKAYYQRKRDEVIERARHYHETHRDEVLQRNRAHYQANRETLLAQQREYTKRNRELVLRRKAEYYERNRDARIAYQRGHYRRNPDLYWAQRRKREARRAGAPGSFTAAEFRALVNLHDGRCAYCVRVTILTADHRIPLCRTELKPTNWIANILPACRRCNSRKGRMTEEEFRVWLQRRDVK